MTCKTVSGLSVFFRVCKINFFKLHLRLTFVKIVLIIDNQACLRENTYLIQKH